MWWVTDATKLMLKKAITFTWNLSTTSKRQLSFDSIHLDLKLKLSLKYKKSKRKQP